MTGFLENLKAQVDALTADMASVKASLNGALTHAATPATPAAPADPFAGLTAAAPAQVAPATVTDEMVMKLVTENVANETIKAGMQQVLAQMGIARLPDTRPDQLPELYQRLSAVVAANAAAPAATAPALPAAAAPAGIL